MTNKQVTWKFNRAVFVKNEPPPERLQKRVGNLGMDDFQDPNLLQDIVRQLNDYSSKKILGVEHMGPRNARRANVNKDGALCKPIGGGKPNRYSLSHGELYIEFINKANKGNRRYIRASQITSMLNRSDYQELGQEPVKLAAEHLGLLDCD